MIKKWILINLTLIFVSLVFIASFNFFMDPFWCFEHSHKYNSIQKATNERQQKSNYIYCTSHTYDTILLGSSRTTYMNRHDFANMQVFNFAAPAMRPQEYLTYIDFVINDTKQPIRNIIIGTDFFGYLNYGLFKFTNAASIVNTSKTSLYRWKVLFSFDATNNSIKNIRDFYYQKDIDRYNRDNVKSSFPKPTDLVKFRKQVLDGAKRYKQDEYSSTANVNFYSIMSTIKTKHNKKVFFIYTTPVSSPLFYQLIESGQYKNYENWLRSLVQIYGTVYHFMYINSVAKNYEKYFHDSNHAYTETNTLIAHKITNFSDNNIPSDFGMLLTRKNIESKLIELRYLNGIVRH